MPDISQWKFITPSSRSRPLSTHYLHRTRPIYSKGINTTASETHFFIPEKTQDKTAQWLNDCIMASALCVDVQTKRRVCFLYLLLSLWKRSGLISFTLEISRLIYRRTSMFALNISRTFVSTIWDNTELVLPKIWNWRLDQYQLFTARQLQNK